MVGGGLGGLIEFLLDSGHLPAMGFVIGGLLAFALSEGMKD
jgi:hypothetical protein